MEDREVATHRLPILSWLPMNKMAHAVPCEENNTVGLVLCSEVVADIQNLPGPSEVTEHGLDVGCHTCQVQEDLVSSSLVEHLMNTSAHVSHLEQNSLWDQGLLLQEMEIVSSYYQNYSEVSKVYSVGHN